MPKDYLLTELDDFIPENDADSIDEILGVLKQYMPDQYRALVRESSEVMYLGELVNF